VPKETGCPLAKISTPDESYNTVEVFEWLHLMGRKLPPGYTEQNDPVNQRERLEHQAGGEQQSWTEDSSLSPWNMGCRQQAASVLESIACCMMPARSGKHPGCHSLSSDEAQSASTAR
jgi:hypothetical protein